MNKRKCKKSRLKMKQTNNRQIKYWYNTNGITLIALVISIIVMLILAGVSLNATIGENGIMTQAKNATYMQGIATLEEYLQSEYVKYYDEADNYTNKVELLVNKISNLCLKDGTKNYITYDGKMDYVLNKQALPEEIRNQLRGGDTTDYLSYIRLKDVYGITEDLRVYYCSEGTDNVLGTLNTSELNPNTPLVKVNTDNAIKSAISDALLTVGVEVGENGVTVGDASKIKDLELDGDKYNITSISALSEISTLKTLTLSNLTLDNLDGLENCTLLTGIYFKNCKVSNYTKLSTAWNLQYLYLYLPPTMSETDANAQVEKLGEGLANATEIKNLEYFGISGTTDMFDGKYPANTDEKSKVFYNVKTYSNLTNIESLDKFSNNLKQSIKYLYLNNNSFKSINSLKDFKNLNEADLMCNLNLENLDGLENNQNLIFLCAQFCNLKNIIGVKGCTKLKTVTLRNNSNLESLVGLEDSKDLDFLFTPLCNINDVTALKDNVKLRYLNLGSNVNLQSIIALKNCTGIRKLYLDNNVNMIGTEVRDALADPITHVLQNCGKNYAIPSKYNIYFTTLTSYNYANLDLTDDSDEINSLKNKTNVTRLNLSGNSKLSDEKLQEILSTMTGLKYLSLTNLQLKSLNFMNNVTGIVELDIRNCNLMASDLSILNTKGTNLYTFVTNNNNIDLTKVQICINNIASKKQIDNILEDSWIDRAPSACRGFITIGDGYNFDECTEIEYYRIATPSNVSNTGTVDLSNSKLKDVNIRKDSRTYIFPRTLQKAYLYEKNKDLSLCSELENLIIIDDADSILATIPNNNKLKELVLNRYPNENLEFLNLFDASNLNFLAVRGNSLGCSLTSKERAGIKTLKGIEKAPNLTSAHFYIAKLNDISAISNCTKLEALRVYDNPLLQNLSGIENLTELKELYAYSASINNIESVSNCTKLNVLKLGDNKISNINALENLNQLTTIELYNNGISDLSALEKIIENGKIKFSELNLSNNLLQTTTLTGHNNVDTLEKLHNAGLQTLNISGNNFTAGTTDRLKNLSWTSYTE